MSLFPPLTYQWPSDSKHNSQEKSCCRCFNATTDHSSLLSTRSAPWTLKPSLIFMLQSVNMCRVYYEWPDWVFIHCVQAPILYIHSRAQMTASNILTFLRWNTKCVLSAQKSFLRTHHMKKLGPAVRAEIWLWSSGWEQTGWVHELQKKFMINILFHNEFFKSAKPDHSYAATAAHSG